MTEYMEYGKAGYEMMKHHVGVLPHYDAAMSDEYPRPSSGAMNVNRDDKGDMEKKQDRYGDNRSDLPNYKEDNEYAYKQAR